MEPKTLPLPLCVAGAPKGLELAAPPNASDGAAAGCKLGNPKADMVSCYIVLLSRTNVFYTITEGNSIVLFFK
jgi:hypothetical protein